jgi:hypothetical protein
MKYKKTTRNEKKKKIKRRKKDDTEEMPDVYNRDTKSTQDTHDQESGTPNGAQSGRNTKDIPVRPKN